MECRRDFNETICPCPKKGCEMHGFCCSCLQKHVALRQLPSCFLAESEATDKNYETFARLVMEKKI